MKKFILSISCMFIVNNFAWAFIPTVNYDNQVKEVLSKPKQQYQQPIPNQPLYVQPQQTYAQPQQGANKVNDSLKNVNSTLNSVNTTVNSVKSLLKPF